ncbi:hypothetical protein AKJ09_01722 [Labilithrix luteola]|uniref:IgGFc-binding protein N-terminal domain-containing protein n=1 Tax=Labilithrix luteola TaxID=1391654 RepID=A0A0K1PNF4_9BACT|nr:hypothetical protein AKJ09_01722 [Labilithrix luteola]
MAFGALLPMACGQHRDDFDGTAQNSFTPDTGADVAFPPACVGVRCSPDLKKVLCQHQDGTEDVFEACGPELGCADGHCAAPCTSAELAKGSIGCAFATLPSDTTNGGSGGSCFAVMIANTWDAPATIQATLGDTPVDIGASVYYAETVGATVHYERVTGAIDPGKAAIVFLAQGSTANVPPMGTFTACPEGVVPAVREDPIAHGTARTRAFLLSTNVPVSAYSIYPYGGASSHISTAMALLPLSSWGKSYIAVSGISTGGGMNSSPTIQIVAAEDDTVVRMRPRVDVRDGAGVPGVGSQQTQSWTLAGGEVLQITQPNDTSGSPVESNKPIGLFGGAECPYVPAQTPACDTLQQQVAPVAQWGSAYALVPYRPRLAEGNAGTDARESVPWRFVGAFDGTRLTYDPSPPPFGAPDTLDAGQAVTFTSTYVGTVRSQDDAHPFHVAAYMTGGSTYGGLGDPDFVTIVPTEQFLDRYVFFTDFTYPETTLSIVRRATPRGFLPVTLDCVGEVPDFRPLGGTGELEYAWVRLTAGGTPQSFASGTCGYGRHEAKSDSPFALYVWGTGQYVSYGYPGGMGSRPLAELEGPLIK